MAQGKTPDCGPHCKIVTKKRAGGAVQTQRLVHCKKRNCTQCHGKPVRR